MGDAEAAFAFVARREGTRTMPAGRWAHTMSLELGWMAPQQAKAFVARAAEAGLLAEEVDGLRFVLDPRGVDVPRGFRPDPEAAIEASPTPMTSKPQATPSATRAPPGAPVSSPEAPVATPAPAPPSHPPTSGPPLSAPVPDDLFAAWLPRVAEAMGMDRDRVLKAVAAKREGFGGLVSGETALLLLAQAAGLDVQDAAADALTASAPALER